MTTENEKMSAVIDAVEEQIEQTHHRNPCVVEKDRLLQLVTDITMFAQTNGEMILDEARKEQEELLEKIRRGKAGNQFLTPPSRYLAEKLYDLWAKNGGAPADLLVIDGRCFHLLHQWFEIRGLPEKLEEPNYKFIIDPNPLGVASIIPHPDDAQKLQRLTITVFEPYSSWQEAYEGKIVRGEEAE